MRAERQQAIESWNRATEALLAVVRGVPASQWSVASRNAGWSNKDVLAHLATGYVVRLALLQSVVETGRPGIAPDAGAANTRHIEARRRVSVDELVAELVTTRAQVLALLRQLSDEALDLEVNDGGGVTRLGNDLLTLSQHDLDHAAGLQYATNT